MTVTPDNGFATLTPMLRHFSGPLGFFLGLLVLAVLGLTAMSLEERAEDVPAAGLAGILPVSSPEVLLQSIRQPLGSLGLPMADRPARIQLSVDEALYHYLEQTLGAEKARAYARKSPAPIVFWRFTFRKPDNDRALLELEVQPGGRIAGLRQEEWNAPVPATLPPRALAEKWVSVVLGENLPDFTLVSETISLDRAGVRYAWRSKRPYAGEARMMVMAEINRGRVVTLEKRLAPPSDVLAAAHHRAVVRRERFTLSLPMGIALLAGMAGLFVLGYRWEEIGNALGGWRMPARKPLMAVLLLAAGVLVKMAWDAPGAAPWVTGVLLGFAGMCLYLMGLAYAMAPAGETVPTTVPRWLFALIPLGYLAAMFSHGDNPVMGCSRICTTLRLTMIPLIGASAYLAAARRAEFALLLFPLSAAALFPHRTCPYAAEILWGHPVGLNPLCFALPFAATAIALAGLFGIRPKFCGAAAAILIVAAAALGVWQRTQAPF
ncbi:MAG: hypothetical protein V1809_10540 [Planctomycetota bacterium]